MRTILICSLFTFILMSCMPLVQITLKTYVDPSIQSSSVKSIAVFALRNTALSPGEGLEMDRAITQAFIQKNRDVTMMGASQATDKLNQAELVEAYSKFLMDFESSGIANTTVLKQIGEKLGVDAILQGRLSEVVQKTGTFALYASTPSITSLTLRYTLISCKKGNTLWEGTSNGLKYGPFNKVPPLYEVIAGTQEKLFTGLPTLGK